MKNLALALATAASLLSPHAAQATTTLDFETATELGGSMQEDSLIFINTVLYNSARQSSLRLKNGLTSGSQAALMTGRADIISASGTFRLASAYLTPVNPNQTWLVRGLLNGTVVYDHTFSLTNTTPLLTTFNNALVDTVYFRSGPRTTMVMDDLTIGLVSLAGAVPEPATWALMILGFGVVAHAMRQAKARGRRGLIAA